MMYAMLATMFSSMESVTRKKALDLSNLPKFLFSMLWFTADILLALLLLFYMDLAGVFANLLWLTLMFMSSVIVMLSMNLSQLLLSTEKMSNLIPYENLDKVFVVIISFFLFYEENSIYTFMITLFTIMFISFFSLDSKNFKFSKNMKLIFLVKFLYALKMMIYWYLLLSYTTLELYSISSMSMVLIMWIMLFKKKEFWYLSQWTKKFYFYSMLASTMGMFTTLLSFFMIQELWLIKTTLLGFFWMISTIMFWYFMLDDKPNLKKIILSFFVLMLISLWYYLA